jgi:hypothetical protein
VCRSRRSCSDGRLRGQGVSGAVGKGRGQARGSVSSPSEETSPRLGRLPRCTSRRGTLPFAVPQLHSIITCIDMMTYTANLHTRGADEVCQSFDSDGLALVRLGSRCHSRWGLGFMFMLS